MSDRNQPCPCGSGKKYKHCCLRQEPPQSPTAAPPTDSRPHAGAVEKAEGWLSTRHRKGWQVAYLRLSDELLDPADLKKLGQLGPETLTTVGLNLTEWLLAEGEIQVQGANRRIPDYLTGPSGPTLTAGQRDWLQQMAQRPLRLYSITDVVPGVQMTLCDALDAGAAPIVVRERSGTRTLVPGMQIGCRIMRVTDHFEMSGAAYPFGQSAGAELTGRLQASAEAFGQQPGLAHRLGLVLMAAWLEQLVTPPKMPKLMDFDTGEALMLVTDHYRVLDWAGLAGRLQGCADVLGDRQNGWAREVKGKDGQSRPIAHINLGKDADTIEIFYKTQGNADQGRGWFDALAIGVVTFLKRIAETPEDAIKRRTQSGNKSAPAARPPDLDPKLMTQAVEEAIRRLYANWADQPIPALNGMTPRQSIGTAAGLERVKGLLRSYEANEKIQASEQGRAEASHDFLWQALGISK